MLNGDNDAMHVDVVVMIVSCWHLFFWPENFKMHADDIVRGLKS